MKVATLTRVVFVLAAVGVASSAHAVPLDGTHLTFTADGITLTVSGNNCTWTGGSCSDLDLLQDGTKLGVTVRAADNTTPLASVSANTDLTFNLNLISASSPVNGILVGVAGFGTNADAGVAPPSPPNLNVYPGQSGSLAFSAIQTVTFNYDIGPANIFDSTPSEVTSVTQDFAVPEPASSALLLAGLVSLTAVNLRRIRR